MDRSGRRHTAAAAAVFSAAALCAFPLFLDRFSNLGVVKFTAGATLCLAFSLWLGACCLVGSRPPRGRFAAARRDPTLWALAAFVAAGILSTVFSLDATASLWGLRGYYGGLVMALYTAAACLAVRAYAAAVDVRGVLCGMGWAALVILAVYLLNAFGFDPLGAYVGIAEQEKGQFFSTLGQFDYVAGGLALLLPAAWYLFLTAEGRRQTLAAAVPALGGTLAFSLVISDGLLLGVGTAALVAVCSRGFRTRHLGRVMLLGASFFGWAGLLRQLRAHFAFTGGLPLLAGLGRWAVPGCLVCLVAWAVLRRCPDRPLYLAGRALAALTVVAALAGLLLANLWPGWPGGVLDNFLVFGWEWGTWRGLAWQAALGAWCGGGPLRWLLGYGPCMTHDAIALWAPVSGIAWPDRLDTFYAAHNEYLEQLLTTGLLGLAAWAVFAAAHLGRAWRHRRRPGVVPVALCLVSYLAQAAVSNRVSMLFPPVMVLFGWLAALCAVPEPAAPAPAKGRKKAAAAAPNPAKRLATVYAAAFAAMWVSGALARVIFWFLY